MSVKRKKYELFVDNEFIKNLNSGWPMDRIMAQLCKSYPDAMRLEVKLCEEDWLALVSK